MEIHVSVIIRLYLIHKAMSTSGSSKLTSSILLIILGVVVFSDLNIIILKFLFGINTDLPEILFFPFAFLLKDSFKNIVVNKGEFLLMIVIWSILCFIGNNQYSQGSIFTHARGGVYIFLFCLIFKEKDTKVDSDTIYYLVIGSLLGWLFCCFISNMMPDSKGFTYGNILAIPLFLSMSYIKGYRKWFYFGILVIVIIAFIAGLRRIIIVSILSLLLIGLFPSAKDHSKHFIKLIMFVTAIGGIIWYNLEYIGRLINSYSPILYYRIFEKTTDSLKGSIVSDEERVDNFDYFQDHMTEELFPNGFLKSWSDGDFGRFNDFPVFQLSYTFGIIISFFILLYLVNCFVRCFKRIKSSNEAYIYLITTFVMFVLLFLDGSFLVSAYITPFTGLCIGKIILLSKTTYFKKL